MKSRFLSSIFWIYLIFIWSCTLEDFDITTVQTDIPPPAVVYVNAMLEVARSGISDEGLELRCQKLAYPFSVITVDSKMRTVSRSIDMIELFQDSSVKILDFVYPFTLKNHFGESQVITDVRILALAVGSCLPSEVSFNGPDIQAYNINFANSCYSIEFPVSLLTHNGDKIDVVSELEMAEKSLSQELYFQFPLILKDVMGRQIIVSDAEELVLTLFDCNGSNFGNFHVFNVDSFSIGCYQYVYPLDVLLDDGSQLYTVKSEQEMTDVFLQGRFYDFVYPITLQKDIQSNLVIHTPEDFFSALVSCTGQSSLFLLLTGTQIFNSLPCFDIIFPITVENEFGETQSFAGYNQLDMIVNDSLLLSYNVHYPIDVILLSTQLPKTIQDDSQLFELLAECP